MRERPRSYDAVIVGGGHNGLVAAAYLARAGRSCLLLERRPVLGGAAVSELVFPSIPARFSRYAYLVSLMPGRIVQELGLPINLLPRRISSYTPDPRAGARRGLVIDNLDRARTAASFRALTGGDSELAAWEGFYGMMRRVAERVFPTMLEPLRSREELRRLVDDEPAWQALFERPIGESLAARFDDELVEGVVLTDATIGTFAAAGQDDLVQNRCLLYHVIGDCTGEWRVPEGGMGALTGALASAARAAGATLVEGADVVQIAPEAGAAEVRWHDGRDEHVAIAEAVLCNAAPRELDRLLGRLDDTEPEPEGSQVKVNMLLARLPRLRDRAVSREEAFAGTFHVNEMAQQLQRAYQQAAAGEIPSPAPCETYAHSLTDPSILEESLQLEGVHAMTVFALHMPARLFRREHATAREHALAAILSSLDEVLAEPIEECLLRAPDGQPCIDVHTPVDLEHELRMPGGHIFHRDLQWPFAESDEEVGAWGVETSDPSILLCGAGARRGGGVSGIAGHNAAMALLERRG